MARILVWRLRVELSRTLSTNGRLDSLQPQEFSRNSDSPAKNVGKDPSVVALAELLLSVVMEGNPKAAPTAEKLAYIPKVIEALVAAAQSEVSANGISEHTPKLTRRRMEVLELIVAGKCPKEIGEELCISVRTVRNHIIAICKALGTRSYREAAEKVRGSKPPVLEEDTEARECTCGLR